MTVGELRYQIENMTDDAVVVVNGEPCGEVEIEQTKLGYVVNLWDVSHCEGT